MDRHIKDNLEEYLRGAMDSDAQAEFEKRLLASEADRRQVASFREHSRLIRETLRAPEEAAPSPGFYGRVMDRIQAQRASLSIWAALIEPQFFRRLAFASATLLLLLSLTMFTTAPEMEEEMLATRPTPAMDAMAEPEPAPLLGEDPEEDRDAILVNLATYQEAQSF